MVCDRCGAQDARFTLVDEHDGVTYSETTLCGDCLKVVVLGAPVDNQTSLIFDEILEGLSS